MRYILFLVITVIIWSCQNQKNVQSVFPESQDGLTATCKEKVIPGQYVIKTENDTLITVTASNHKEFIEKWITPNLHHIKRAETLKIIHAPDSTILPQNSPTESTSPYWGQERTETVWAHNNGFRGQGAIIAVIDSAVDITHPALKEGILLNFAELNGVPNEDDDQNGFVDDIWGWDFVTNRPLSASSSFDHHGTHVAGIIVGNTTGWSGVAPLSKVLPISFIDQNGFGHILGAAQAVRYAVSRKVDIINASWGGTFCSLILQEEIAKAVEQGIIFVTASGNEGVNLDQVPFYPAVFQFPLQITVASSRMSDYLASYSNTSYQYVHLGAPGDGIWSTVTHGQMAYMSGTSMAAPFVSGAIAVLKSAAPWADSQLLRQAILRGVDSRDYRVSTRGRLNIRKSIQWLLSQKN